MQRRPHFTEQQAAALLAQLPEALNASASLSQAIFQRVLGAHGTDLEFARFLQARGEDAPTEPHGQLALELASMEEQCRAFVALCEQARGEATEEAAPAEEVDIRTPLTPVGFAGGDYSTMAYGVRSRTLYTMLDPDHAPNGAPLYFLVHVTGMDVEIIAYDHVPTAEELERQFQDGAINGLGMTVMQRRDGCIHALLYGEGQSMGGAEDWSETLWSDDPNAPTIRSKYDHQQ